MTVNLTAGNHDLILVKPATGTDDVSITGLIFQRAVSGWRSGAPLTKILMYFSV